MSDRDWTELAAAYSLDALDAEEGAEFEKRLAVDQQLQREVDTYREVVGEIGHVLPPIQPPDELRERILGRARTGPNAASLLPLTRPPTSDRFTRWVSVPWLAAAASIVLAMGVGAAYRQSGLERVRLQDQLGDALSALAESESASAQQDSVVATFIGPEVHVVSLSADGGKPVVRVFWNHIQEQFIVTAFGLPAAPAGRTYQLWAMPQGQAPVSMGTFDMDSDERTALILPVPADVLAIDFVHACGLTVEPAGGSRQPTETPRLVGDWRHAD